MRRYPARLLILVCLAAGGCAAPPAKISAPADPFAPVPEPPVTRMAFAPERSIDALKEAIGLLREGQFAQADATLEEVRRIRPDIPEVHFNLGWAKLQRRKYPEAVEHFRDGLKLRPGEVRAYALEALAYREQGRFSEAEKTYRDGLGVAPESDLLHYNLGILYDLYLGDPAQALEHYQTYQKLQVTPDLKVAGWIVVLERDAKKREAAQNAPPPPPASVGSAGGTVAAPPKATKRRTR